MAWMLEADFNSINIPYIVDDYPQHPSTSFKDMLQLSPAQGYSLPGLPYNDHDNLHNSPSNPAVSIPHHFAPIPQWINSDANDHRLAHGNSLNLTEGFVELDQSVPVPSDMPQPEVRALHHPRPQRNLSPIQLSSTKNGKVRGTRATTSQRQNRAQRPTNPFQCRWEGCRHDCSFGRKAELMRHIELLHVSPGSYECPHCSRAFNRKDNLAEHMRSRHASSGF